MRSLRAAAVAAAVLLLCALAVVMTWPADAEIAEWTASDLVRDEPVPQDEEAGELAARRHEVEPETAADEREVPADPAERARTITLRGRVLDTAGAPIAGASVHLELRGVQTERVRRPARTAPDGTFALRGPLRGVKKVSVLAAHPDFAAALVDRDVPGTGDDLPLGDIRLGRGARVRGSVLRADGSAVAGAAVTLQAEGTNRSLWMAAGRQGFGEQQTDPGGWFEFRHVPPGAFRAIARATRMVPGSSDSFTAAEGEEETLGPIVLLPGALLTGLVTDRLGKPIAKANVRVAAAGVPGPQHPGVTDAEGRFAIDHLQPRLSDILVFAAGFVGHRSRIDLARESERTIALDQGLVIRGTVRDAATGAPIESFAVQARRLGGLLPPMPSEHAGKTRDEVTQQIRQLSRAHHERGDDPAVLAQLAELQRALAAIDGARATKRPPGGAVAQDPGPLAAHHGGAFTLSGLDAGIYAVDVKADDYLLTRSDPVELRVGEPAPDLVVALQRGVSVSGKVVQQSDGAGIAGARIELMRLSPQAAATPSPRGPTIARAVSTSDGSFVLRNVAPGHSALRVTARGYASATGAPFVASAGTAPERIELSAQATLHGRVQGVQGRTGEVTVVVAAARSIAARPLAEDGTFRFEDVAPGAYRVRAYLAESRGAIRAMNALLRAEPPVDVSLAAGEDRELDLVLTTLPLASLRGSLRVNGVAAAGYQIELVPVPGTQGQGRHSTQVEPDGGFLLRAVEPGAYDVLVLSIARNRNELARQRITLAADEERAIVLDVGAAELTGQIRFADGRPVEGTLRVVPRDAADAAPLRDERALGLNLPVRGGRFRADPLAPGAYRLELRAPGAELRADVQLAPGERKQVVLEAQAAKTGAR